MSTTEARMVVLPRDRHDARETTIRRLLIEATELADHNGRLQAQLDRNPRNPLFVGRCYLCGAHIKPSRLLCTEHSWAAGEVSVHTKGQPANPAWDPRGPARKERTQ